MFFVNIYEQGFDAWGLLVQAFPLRASCRDGKSLGLNVVDGGDGQALRRNVAGMRLTLGEDLAFGEAREGRVGV